MTEETKRKCFVIMPFSKTTDKHTEEYWEDHFEFLKPLIESHTLSAYRSEPLRGDVLRQIITDLVTVPIVVADLTDKNPNVYWELGVRQSFKHCTVTIAEYGTPLPFDLGVKGTLFYYPGDHIKMREFEKQFSNAIDDCLKNPNSPDSHVLETIGGRGTLFQILMKEESLRRLDALLSEISSNFNTLDRIKKICEENAIARKENKPSPIRFETGRYLVASAEALIVNRYIDADISFYNSAENYLLFAIACNEQLSVWSFVGLTNAEEWLFNTDDSMRKLTIDFKKLVISQRERISSSL